MLNQDALRHFGDAGGLSGWQKQLTGARKRAYENNPLAQPGAKGFAGAERAGCFISGRRNIGLRVGFSNNGA